MLDKLSSLSNTQRIKLAQRIKNSNDINLPRLKYFNTAPCVAHSKLTVGCRNCGVELRRHQREAVAWLFAIKKGLIAHPVGSGKTAMAAGLIALMRQAGEAKFPKRILVVCRSPAVSQWVGELNRMLPDFRVIASTGVPSKRIDKYLTYWNITVIGYQMLSKDLEHLQNFDFDLVVVDDVDAIRKRSNQATYAVKLISRQSSRIVVLTATPLQKRLLELYHLLEVIGGREVLGSESNFKRRYIRGTRPHITYDNLDEFKSKIAHMALRRSTDEMDDVEMPALAPPNNVFLDLYPAQRERYEELRSGVLRIIKEQGEDVKRVEAMAKFTYGQQICAGLPALGEADGPGASVKLDWVERNVVDGDFSDEKIVIFCHNIRTIEALHLRLQRHGIEYETIWGRDNKAENRLKSQQRFWDDPACRILIGSSAIEQSLNLQVARHLICVDTILNPARMTQIAGRIRRVGSVHKTVYTHNLFTYNTQEERYLDMLRREQTLSDFVWDSSSELYESLSGLDLLLLIGGNSLRQKG